jgi:hypothetical protein
MREEALIAPLDTWLGQEFGPLQRHHTIAAVVNQATIGAPPVPHVAEGPTVADYDAKLARYRAALDAGADPAVVAAWIADTQAERQRVQQHAQQPMAAVDETSRLTVEQITAIVDELGGMINALRDADPEHKLDVYRTVGLHLTYEPDTQTVRAVIDLGAHRWDSVCVRGGTATIRTRRGVVAVD